jgi:hypothetical protein
MRTLWCVCVCVCVCMWKDTWLVFTLLSKQNYFCWCLDFWDVTFCWCVSRSQCSREFQCLHHFTLLNCWRWRNYSCSECQKPSHPMTHYHVPEAPLWVPHFFQYYCSWFFSLSWDGIHCSHFFDIISPSLQYKKQFSRTIPANLGQHMLCNFCHNMFQPILKHPLMHLK